MEPVCREAWVEVPIFGMTVIRLEVNHHCMTRSAVPVSLLESLRPIREGIVRLSSVSTGSVPRANGPRPCPPTIVGEPGDPSFPSPLSPAISEADLDDEDAEMVDQELEEISEHMIDNTDVNCKCLETLNRLLSMATTAEGARVALKFNDTLNQNTRGLHTSQAQTDRLFNYLPCPRQCDESFREQYAERPLRPTAQVADRVEQSLAYFWGYLAIDQPTDQPPDQPPVPLTQICCTL